MLVEIPDLDLEKIYISGQCFRWKKQEDGAYRIPHKGSCLTIRQEAPELFAMDCSETEFESVWRPYFDLDTDYVAINSRISPDEDPSLYRAMSDQRGVRILRQDTWEMIITSIITQNRNIPAIRRSVELLSALAGDRGTDSAGREYYCFATPEQILAMDERSLAACRLGYREDYVQRTAEAACAGKLRLELLPSMTDRECREQLLSLYGVGEKVAACMLLFGLHRLDAFPKDVWMNRVLCERYPNGFPFEAIPRITGSISSTFSRTTAN